MVFFVSHRIVKHLQDFADIAYHTGMLTTVTFVLIIFDVCNRLFISECTRLVYTI